MLHGRNDARSVDLFSFSDITNLFFGKFQISLNLILQSVEIFLLICKIRTVLNVKCFIISFCFSIAGLNVRLFVRCAYREILQFAKDRLLCKICWVSGDYDLVQEIFFPTFYVEMLLNDDFANAGN